MEGEEDLIAAAEHIVNTLKMKKNLSGNTRKILANLGSQLSNITRASESEDNESKEDEGLIEIEHQLNNIQDKIMNWEKDQSMIWDYGPEEAYEYLKAVNEARKLTEILENKRIEGSSEGTSLLHRAHDVLRTAMSRLEEEFKYLLVQYFLTRASESKDNESKEDEGLIEIEHQLNNIQDKIMNWEKDKSMIWDYGPDEAYEYLKAVNEARKLTEILENKRIEGSSGGTTLLHRAHDVLRTAMSRLEEEFKYLLVQNRQPFKPEHMSFRSSEVDIIDSDSVLSFGDDFVEDVGQRDSVGRFSVDYVIELVHPDAIPDLRSIASLMFDSNYGRECSQAFISVQKDALDDCLFILEVEKSSIEDVLEMERSAFNSRIRMWVRAMKIFVRGYLASEKLLSDRIFGEHESVSSVCFVESSKTAFMQLLQFAEAIAIGSHQPEKLFKILDMYEVLANLIPDIETLYNNENGSYVRIESQDILKRLRDCANTTFLELKNAVASNVSANPFPGGGVHPLARYVMNYVKVLMDYKKTLHEILKDQEIEESSQLSPEENPISEEEDNINESSGSSPMAIHFRSLFSILETNIDEKSNLYKDESLHHFFLMNNVHYMAEKVKGSELRTVFGDDWIKKHNWKFQQLAMSYERATWSSILGLLKDEGIYDPGSNSISRTIIKERMQSFYAAFEEVYKNQTSWLILDSQLRDDLRISTSLRVIQAYRSFVGRFHNHISEKHIKYSADDLEDRIMDLFEGSQKSLHRSSKK